MSNQVTENFVKQFSANVFHLSQQKGSLLQGCVRNESQHSKIDFYDSIGAVAAVKKTGRFMATPHMDTPHGRRAVSLEDFIWSDTVDKEDKLRMIYDPTSQYAMAAMWAFGRSKDDVIIAAALGSAYTGEEGTTAVPMANANKLAAFDESAESTSGHALNLDTLIGMRAYFAAGQVDKSLKKYFAVTNKQIGDLLKETEVTSADYTAVKALVKGEINSFMGFEFVEIERLPVNAVAYFDATNGAIGSSIAGSYDGTLAAGAGRICLAWAQDGILLATGADVSTTVDRLPEKCNSTQILSTMSIGAVRMEEAKVLEVLCKE